MLNTDGLTEFSFETLHELDNGEHSALLRALLAGIKRDCVARPLRAGSDQPEARKLIIELSVLPVAEIAVEELGDGREARRVHCQEVRLTLQMQTKLPHHKSKSVSLAVGTTGLFFNPDASDNVRQDTFEFSNTKEL